MMAGCPTRQANRHRQPGSGLRAAGAGGLAPAARTKSEDALSAQAGSGHRPAAFQGEPTEAAQAFPVERHVTKTLALSKLASCPQGCDRLLSAARETFFQLRAGTFLSEAATVWISNTCSRGV